MTPALRKATINRLTLGSVIRRRQTEPLNRIFGRHWPLRETPPSRPCGHDAESPAWPRSALMCRSVRTSQQGSNRAAWRNPCGSRRWPSRRRVHGRRGRCRRPRETRSERASFSASMLRILFYDGGGFWLCTRRAHRRTSSGDPTG